MFSFRLYNHISCSLLYLVKLRLLVSSDVHVHSTIVQYIYCSVSFPFLILYKCIVWISLHSVSICSILYVRVCTHIHINERKKNFRAWCSVINTCTLHITKQGIRICGIWFERFWWDIGRYNRKPFSKQVKWPTSERMSKCEIFELLDLVIFIP